MKLSRRFFSRRTDLVARDLLGCILVRRIGNKKLSGKIVETEAYFGEDDPASHAYRGVTPRNKIMFGRPGFTYVYFVYGNHHCLNFTTEKVGKAGAVLIRALEPLEGTDVMMKNRGIKEIRNLTNGPGKLTKALGITREQNGLDLTGDILYVLKGEKPKEIVQTTRIGIKDGKEMKLRFYIKDNKFVSVK
ncbi:MAG: DNA-3-methyladenine glycosylase [Candidatus Aenigmarchaeota archaeon]|nr:DNA-3-methyladenine glycosylase [Candidatus Aenigmarchaeota archaeon]